MNAPAWVNTVLAVAAVLVAVGTIYRYVWPGVRGLYRIVKKVEEGAEDYHTSGGFGGLAQQNAALGQRLDTIEDELRKTNGGSTLRDLARLAREGVDRLEGNVEELKGYAAQNREGIADLRDQANDLARRLTDVDEKADAQVARLDQQSQRITDHRRRNDETITAIRDFLEGEHRDALLAREALQASVTELLHMSDEPISPEVQMGDD